MYKHINIIIASDQIGKLHISIAIHYFQPILILCSVPVHPRVLRHHYKALFSLPSPLPSDSLICPREERVPQEGFVHRGLMDGPLSLITMPVPELRPRPGLVPIYYCGHTLNLLYSPNTTHTSNGSKHSPLTTHAHASAWLLLRKQLFLLSITVMPLVLDLVFLSPFKLVTDFISIIIFKLSLILNTSSCLL